MKLTASDAGLLLPDGRTVPWAEVYRLDRTRRGAFVACGAGLFKVERATADAVEARIAPWEPGRDAWWLGLSDAERAAILGLAPGERLTVVQRHEPQKRRVSQVFGLLALIFGSLPGLWLATRLESWPLALGSLLVGVALAWRVARNIGRAGDAAADAEQLALPLVGAAPVAWTDLRELPEHARGGPFTSQSEVLQLLTRDGPRWFEALTGEARRLRALVEAVLGARAAAVPRPAVEGVYARSLFSRRALLIDARGVTEFTRSGASLTRWIEVGTPEWRADGPRVRIGGRRYRLGLWAGGRAAALALERGLAEGAASTDDSGAVRAELIEQWLGVEPGGVLHCRPAWWRTWVRVLFVVVVLAPVLTGIPHLMWLLFLLSGLCGSALWERGVTVEADAHGLSVRRGRRRDHYAWDEVEEVLPVGRSATLQTSRGGVELPASTVGVGQVVGVLQRLLAERGQGALLPTDRPLPHTALSRLGAEPEGLERGLSRSAEEQP